MSPSTTKSSTPVTVTNCGVFQLPALNCTELTERTPSVTSELLRLMVTLAVGWVSSTMLNWALQPLSAVLLEICETTMPGSTYRWAKMPDVSPGPLPSQATRNWPLGCMAMAG